jgi:hypothetical protein
MKTYVKAGPAEYDNSGNELTAQQSAFFRSSQVRDYHGKLFVCYHATCSDFDVFDKLKIGSGAGGSFGTGFYFALSESLATSYGDTVLACYLNITNPLHYYQYGTNKLVLELMQADGYQFTPEDIQNCDEEYSEDVYDIVDIVWANGYSSSDFSNSLIKAGYDGIFIDEEIIAFEPNQIKAISNKNPTMSSNIYM